MRRLDWERDNVWIELKGNTDSLRVCINVMYIPPRASFELYEKYYDCLSEIMCMRAPNAKFVIFGDFNFGASISWYKEHNE